MKGFFAYILLLTVVARPIYNVGYLAYYELNIDYIIDTYCVNKEQPEFQCNGKCHLAKQLTNTSQGLEDDTPYLNSLFETITPVYFQKYTLDANLCCVEHMDIINNWGYSKGLYYSYQDKLYRPPRA